MNFFKLPVILLSIVLSLVACNAAKNDKSLVDNIKPASQDEYEIIQMVENIKVYISSSQWDKWLDMYTDDAVLTTREGNVTKEEMRRSVEGISYKITDMHILKKEINSEDASVSVQFKGNGKAQKETYYFKKIDGAWFIVAESNP